MKYPDNIREVAALKPDYLGFIFFPQSKRYAEPLDQELVRGLASSIKTTAVFVDATESQILEICKQFGFRVVQLHGKETPELCRSLKKKGLEVLKVFLLDKNANFESMEQYLDVCDYFLFDTKSESHGGSGQTFDWSVLQQYPYSKPFFLSGGLSLENIAEVSALKSLPLYGIDVNSRFEISPGLKDTAKLQELRWRLS